MKTIKEMLHGNLLIFTLGDLLRQLSLFITFPYFSLYIQSLGGNPIIIGLVYSLRSVAAFFVYPIAGYLSENYNRVKIIAFTGYLYSILYLAFALAPDWRFLALVNFTLGLLVFSFPAMSSLMADSISHNYLGLSYSLWRAIPGAVGIISPFIGGYFITILSVNVGMRLLYSLTFLVTLLISTINLKFLKETKKVKTQEQIHGVFITFF